MSTQEIFKAMGRSRQSRYEGAYGRGSENLSEEAGDGFVDSQNNEESMDEEVSALFCAECGALVSGYLNESEVDECPICHSTELNEKVVKVVRDGQVVKKNIKSKKKKLSAAQRAALAKARKKAHTASANKKRNKSTAKGRKAGLHEEDLYVCEECGYEGEYDDFSKDKNGNLICPECGAVVLCEEAGDLTGDLKALLEEVGAPKSIYQALDEGKVDFVQGYIDLKMGK